MSVKAGSLQPTLIAGRWNSFHEQAGYHAVAPATGEAKETYPRSDWNEIDLALASAEEAFQVLYDADPSLVAEFLNRYADRIEALGAELVEIAATETALPASPRLADIELPRTIDQLRQAAAATEDRSWTRPTIATGAGISSMLVPIPGAVFVLGPNNFPLAFNAVSGGDFAAAIATRHPVIAKANPGHPGTTRLLAEEARAAAKAVGLPPGTVQLMYDMDPKDGLRLVADKRIAATAYTGSRKGGLALKASADAAGRLIYAEMSSINPVVVLPGAAADRGSEIAVELADSLLLGNGQFCTNPGVTMLVDDAAGENLLAKLSEEIVGRSGGPLLGQRVKDDLNAARQRWEDAGATLLAEGGVEAANCSFPPTVMRVTSEQFIASPELHEEAFGNMGLVVVAPSVIQVLHCINSLEGNLTGTIYAVVGEDEEAYEAISRHLGQKVGRILNDKMPTGVAVSPAMNHGGPFPATTHPGFTAVGIPASLTRFGALLSFDNVSDHRLPDELKASNPLAIQRLVDGAWTDATF